MSEISNAIIALTGGGSGLGLGLARYFARQGAQLAIFEIAPQKIQSLRCEFGDDVLVHAGDIRDAVALQSFHDAVIAKFGAVDALVGVQGIWDGNRPLADLAIDVVRAAFDEVMQVNVLGYILSAKIFRESLAKRKGAIVLTASSNASIAADGGGIFYTASKHAVAGVTRQLAFEFGPNVRVNAVAPAGIALSDLRGPRAAGLDSESQNDAPKDMFLTAFRKLTLLDHMPSGEEYGPLYALLAAPGARIMTGDIVMADQGLWNRPLISANR